VQWWQEGGVGANQSSLCGHLLWRFAIQQQSKYPMLHSAWGGTASI